MHSYMYACACVYIYICTYAYILADAREVRAEAQLEVSGTDPEVCGPAQRPSIFEKQNEHSAEAQCPSTLPEHVMCV